MKKLFSIIFSVVLCFGILTGCSNTSSTNTKNKINIVCTIYPQYDWVMNLIGENTSDYNVSLLVNNGVDLHNFQPSAKDIVTISTCDFFLYVGGESDSWVQEVITDAGNDDMISMNMMDVLGDMAQVEEVIEGMENHDHEEKHEDDHPSKEETSEYDEHIWLSLKNAQVICKEISSKLCKLTPKNSDTIENACTDYLAKLASLDSQYTNVVNSAKRNVLLFGDRFPFRYLVEDYEIDYYAAFPGCSAETEASFNTIVFLAEKMDSLSLPVVCVTESSDRSVAKTIIENTKSKDANILAFDSMQSVTENDIKNGISYFSIMESNLSVLETALN